MHELAIAESLVAAVVDKTGEQRVTTVRLSLGRLGGVVADALTFSFEIATLGTTLEGATLEIEAQPGRAACRDCGTTFAVDDFILLCPCGSADVDVVSGRELQIMSVEVS